MTRTRRVARWLTTRHYSRIDGTAAVVLGYLLGARPSWWGTWAVFAASAMLGPRYLSWPIRRLCRPRGGAS